jgi:DNA-binding NarL/FixJ family response regulator
MKLIRVAIADDHQLFVEGLKHILKNKHANVTSLAGAYNTLNELLEGLGKEQPDVLLLDLNLPDGDGLEAIALFKSRYKDMRIIALTMYDDVKLIQAAFKNGVDGYVLKTNTSEDLVMGIQEVMLGNRFLGSGIRLVAEKSNIQSNTGDNFLSLHHFDDKFIKKYDLTKREIEILKMLTQAMSNKQIAKSLFISDQTVSVHRKNIMRKLGAYNAASLVKIVYENDLV